MLHTKEVKGGSIFRAQDHREEWDSPAVPLSSQLLWFSGRALLIRSAPQRPSDQSLSLENEACRGERERSVGNRAGKPLKDKREKPGDAADDLRLRSPNGASPGTWEEGELTSLCQ